MSNPLHNVALNYFEAFFGGKLDNSYFTPDFKAWTTIGPAELAIYPSSVNNIMSLFTGGNGKFNYEVLAITAEGDRVVVEVNGHGTFADGTTYENSYAFVLKIRDGKVAWIAEHFNPIPAMEKLFPRIDMTVIG